MTALPGCVGADAETREDSSAAELLTAKAIGGDVVIDSHYETSRHE